MEAGEGKKTLWRRESGKSGRGKKDLIEAGEGKKKRELFPDVHFFVAPNNVASAKIILFFIIFKKK